VIRIIEAIVTIIRRTTFAETPSLARRVNAFKSGKNGSRVVSTPCRNDSRPRFISTYFFSANA